VVAAKESEVLVKSPLSSLSETIRLVIESSSQYSDTLRKNEAATRTVLIDPVLRSLGWDTANTSMVEVERAFEQTRVDYALYDPKGSVRIIVEAKALGSNLNDNAITRNIVNYAFTYETQDLFLTDGIVWKHVTGLQPGKVEISEVSFSVDSLVDCAAFLVQRLDAARLWPEEQSIDTLADKVTRLEAALATLQREFAKFRASRESEQSANKPVMGTPVLVTIPPPPVAAVKGAPPDAKFEELDRLPNLRHKTPLILRLPDGTEVETHTWKDVLRESCRFALNHNPNIPIPLANRAGKTIRLFSAERPKGNVSFFEEQYNGRVIYIYDNYDANYAVANALHALNQVQRDSWKVKPGLVLVSG
jgi:hypothetical protein